VSLAKAALVEVMTTRNVALTSGAASLKDLAKANITPNYASWLGIVKIALADLCLKV
jgi:hypothetical protein